MEDPVRNLEKTRTWLKYKITTCMYFQFYSIIVKIHNNFLRFD
jgi:hypothetical protein